jgi:signal peptidase I
MGDFVIGYKLPYGFKLPFSELRYGQAIPRRNDVLVFRCPDALGQSCVKRVVALAGDRVEIKKQRLFINGQAAEYSPAGKPRQGEVILNEKWRGHARQITISANESPQNFGPYVVPPNSFFALADNRDKSIDSRHWGAVSNQTIEARLLFVWLSVGWSENTSGQLRPSIRFKRMFSRVY